MKKGDSKKYVKGLSRQIKIVLLRWNGCKMGDKLIELCFQAAVFAPYDKKENAITQFKSVWKAKGWELVQPLLVQWPLLISMLPLVSSEGHFHDLKQLGVTKQATSWNAINVMPLQGENKGQRKGQLLLGSCGQIAFFDPFATQADNYNVAGLLHVRSWKISCSTRLSSQFIG